MGADLTKIEEEIVRLLGRERSPLTTEDICSKLGLQKVEASAALYNLLKKGAVRRVYTESYDPTRPFDTASWTLEDKALMPEERFCRGGKDALNRYARLVLSVPLSMLGLRDALLNRYGALELHDAYAYIIEAAKRELKIMCPIIDSYALYPLVAKVRSSKDLRIKILTELEKSRDVIYLAASLESAGRVEVRDVAKIVNYGGYQRKAFGMHAKLVIADGEVALLGTFNLSKQHYLVNFDIGFLVYDASIVGRLSSIFDEMWSYVSSAK